MTRLRSLVRQHHDRILFALIGVLIVVLGVLAAALLARLHSRVVAVQPSPVYREAKADRQPLPRAEVKAAAPVTIEGRSAVRLQAVEDWSGFDLPVVRYPTTLPPPSSPAGNVGDLAAYWPPLASEPLPLPLPKGMRVQITAPHDICASHGLRRVHIRKYSWRCRK